MIAKNGKHRKKGKAHGAEPSDRPWDPYAGLSFEERPDSQARAHAYARLMGVETRLYELWEQRSGGEMDWIGEVMRDVVDEDMNLWISAVGDKVAALGGHLELVAVFPDQTVTLLHEPGLNTGRDDGGADEDPPNEE